jgi:hypothetical protein
MPPPKRGNPQMQDLMLQHAKVRRGLLLRGRSDLNVGLVAGCTFFELKLLQYAGD